MLSIGVWLDSSSLIPLEFRLNWRQLVERAALESRSHVCTTQSRSQQKRRRFSGPSGAISLSHSRKQSIGSRGPKSMFTSVSLNRRQFTMTLNSDNFDEEVWIILLNLLRQSFKFLSKNMSLLRFQNPEAEDFVKFPRLKTPPRWW